MSTYATNPQVTNVLDRLEEIAIIPVVTGAYLLPKSPFAPPAPPSASPAWPQKSPSFW